MNINFELNGYRHQYRSIEVAWDAMENVKVRIARMGARFIRWSYPYPYHNINVVRVEYLKSQKTA